VAAGDLTAAAEHYRAALAIVRRLTEAHLDVFLPELTSSLTSLGVVLTELGGHDEAQALDREALTIYLRLHRRQPDRFADDVENAKRNMVIDLMNFGRTEGEAARELDSSRPNGSTLLGVVVALTRAKSRAPSRNEASTTEAAPDADSSLTDVPDSATTWWSSPSTWTQSPTCSTDADAFTAPP
jgi:hypothetical protein